MLLLPLHVDDLTFLTEEPDGLPIHNSLDASRISTANLYSILTPPMTTHARLQHILEDLFPIDPYLGPGVVAGYQFDGHAGIELRRGGRCRCRS